MTVAQLVDHLIHIQNKYENGGDLPVDILTETEDGQVQQSLGDLAVSTRTTMEDKTPRPIQVILLPKGFR